MIRALVLCLVTTGAAVRAESPVPGSAEAPLAIELPESLGTIYHASPQAPLRLDAQEVRARRVLREVAADRVEISGASVEARDGGSVADLAPLLPSTHLGVNSRGESLFMVRGSSERHLRVALDGIELTVPWDERTDLSLLALTGVGGVVAQRGVGGVLDPPQTLAGRVDLLTRRQTSPGSLTRFGAAIGEVGWRSGQLLHQRRDGDWTTTAAGEFGEREAFLLPDDPGELLHQDPTRRARTNSDQRRTSLLLRVARDRGERGESAWLVQASEIEKGVPPEEFTSDARFWRYPRVRRLLLGSVHRWRAERWSVDAHAAFDAFGQEIASYADAGFDSVLAREEGRSRTASARAVVARDWGERWSTAGRLDLRQTWHTEDEATVERDYEQRLLSVASELRLRASARTRLRLGAGYERASTPSTDSVADRAAESEPVLHAALEHEFTSALRSHLSLSRRSRFPSLRELFSDALDRFDVNPSLRAERQDAFEAGLAWTGGRLGASANAFWQEIDGAIERVRLPSGQRQRVNLDRVRILGLELGVAARIARGLQVDLQHAFLRSRAREDGGFDARVEDRPDWIGSAALTWTHPSGWRINSEWAAVGPRYGLGDGLERLDADLRGALRLSWRHFGTGGPYGGSEYFVAVENLLDTPTESQVGLPESGRMFRAGLRVDLGRP